MSYHSMVVPIRLAATMRPIPPPAGWAVLAGVMAVVTCSFGGDGEVRAWPRQWW